MPVVIKELVITATLDANAAPVSAETAAAPAAAAQQHQLLLQECVAQVLAVLREQLER